MVTLIVGGKLKLSSTVQAMIIDNLATVLRFIRPGVGVTDVQEDDYEWKIAVFTTPPAQGRRTYRRCLQGKDNVVGHSCGQKLN